MEDEEVEDDSEGVDGADEDSGDCCAEGFRTASGTDFNANDSTSTVSNKSPANRVIAKSLVCSFSLAAFRWRFRKSAWRYRRRPYIV